MTRKKGPHETYWPVKTALPLGFYKPLPGLPLDAEAQFSLIGRGLSVLWRRPGLWSSTRVKWMFRGKKIGIVTEATFIGRVEARTGTESSVVEVTNGGVWRVKYRF
jgi:hypothetical protein